MEVFLNLNVEILVSGSFQGSITCSDKLYGSIFLQPALDQKLPKTSNLISAENVSKTHVPKRKIEINQPITAPKSQFTRTKMKSVTDNVPVQPTNNMSSSDMIKIMQDFETKKKSFCIVCKYETPHQGTMKRHVEAKHLPQTISLNCLQCEKTFNLKQTLKTHYMKVHGLLEAAAKAMLP